MGRNRSTIGQEMADLRRELADLRNAARLGSSSIEGGKVEVYDESGSLRAELGDSGAVPRNGPPPPTPSAPVVTPVLAALQVRWDGQFTDAIGAPDAWARVEVHVGETAGFTLTADTLRATVETAQGGTVTLSLPYAPVWVRLRSRSTSGVAGLPSRGTVGTPVQAGAPDIAAGSITARELSAEAVNGRIITGSIVRTAASGRRVELTPSDPVQGDPATLYYPGSEDGVLLPGRIVTTVQSPPAPSDPTAPELPTTGWLAAHAPASPTVVDTASLKLRTGTRGEGAIPGIVALTADDGTGIVAQGATDKGGGKADMLCLDKSGVLDRASRTEYRVSLDESSLWAFAVKYKNGVPSVRRRVAEFEFRPGMTSQVSGLGPDAPDGSRIDGRVQWNHEGVTISSATVPAGASVPNRSDTATRFDLRAGANSWIAGRGKKVGGSRTDGLLHVSEARVAVAAVTYDDAGTVVGETVPLWVPVVAGQNLIARGIGVAGADGKRTNTETFLRHDHFVVSAVTTQPGQATVEDVVLFLDTRPAAQQGGRRRHRVDGYWAAGEWLPLGLANAWTSDGAQCRVMPDATIQLTGRLLPPAGTPVAAVQVGVVPASCRPARPKRLAVPTADAGGTATVLIQPTGEVIVQGWTGTLAYVGLDGIRVALDA